MKVSEVSDYIPSLSLVKNEEVILTGICDRHNLEGHKVYFCGGKTFVEVIQNYQGNDLVIFFDKSFYESLGEDSQELEAKASVVATVDNIPLAMSALSQPFYNKLRESFNDEVDGRKLGAASIDPTARIGENVFLGSDVVIGEDVILHSGVRIMSRCEVGAGTEIYPNVTLMPQTKVGAQCRIHSGSVIGSDGFGYNFENGVHKKVWHMGGVVIGNDVEVGSNTSIDQGTFSPTVIGDGSKIDNQVQIGHNCRLGRGVIVCAQVGVSGSVEIGDYCVFGGQAGVAPDVKIGMGAQVAGGAGVTGYVDAGAKVAGHPARPLKEWLRVNATLRKMVLKK